MGSILIRKAKWLIIKALPKLNSFIHGRTFSFYRAIVSAK